MGQLRLGDVWSSVALGLISIGLLWISQRNRERRSSVLKNEELLGLWLICRACLQSLGVAVGGRATGSAGKKETLVLLNTPIGWREVTHNKVYI